LWFLVADTGNSRITFAREANGTVAEASSELFKNTSNKEIENSKFF
jgi:hypothetical protein